jgi:hypothetical protein
MAKLGLLMVIVYSRNPEATFCFRSWSNIQSAEQNIVQASNTLSSSLAVDPVSHKFEPPFYLLGVFQQHSSKPGSICIIDSPFPLSLHSTGGYLIDFSASRQWYLTTMPLSVAYGRFFSQLCLVKVSTCKAFALIFELFFLFS